MIWLLRRAKILKSLLVIVESLAAGIAASGTIRGIKIHGKNWSLEYTIRPEQ
jgi:hypothetical protein